MSVYARRRCFVCRTCLELVEVLEEGGLRDFKGLADEVTEAGVALFMS